MVQELGDWSFNGGATALILAANHPQWVSRLFLIDPSVFPPWLYWLIKCQYRLLGSHFSDFVKNRRRYFDSQEAMLKQLKKKQPFKYWRQQVLYDYCQYGLVEVDGNQRFSLACQPEVEANYYREAMNYNRGVLSLVHQPVTIMTAKSPSTWLFSGFDTSPTDPRLPKYLTQSVCVEVIDASDYSHFIPMENPELIIQWVKNCVNDHF